MTNLAVAPGPAAEETPIEDRRRHERVKLTLPGRFMTPEGGEHNCLTVDVSASGIRLQTAQTPAHGARVIAYLQELGRLEGFVVRRMADGFAFALKATPRKIEKLEGKIGWLLQKEAGASDRRLTPRLELDGAFVVMLNRDGRQEVVELVDISATGVAFRTDLALTLGERVEIGAQTAAVTRLFDGGAAVNFL